MVTQLFITYYPANRASEICLDIIALDHESVEVSFIIIHLNIAAQGPSEKA
jgi:hypothetical protein